MSPEWIILINTRLQHVQQPEELRYMIAVGETVVNLNGHRHHQLVFMRDLEILGIDCPFDIFPACFRSVKSIHGIEE